QEVRVDTAPHHLRAREVVREKPEGSRIDIEHGDIRALPAVFGGQRRADAAAAHDYDSHGPRTLRCYSRTGWRQSQTLQGAAFRTYCVSRPIWYSPSGALCSAPMRMRSTLRSIASSTMA